jgi:hypothetical protein
MRQCDCARGIAGNRDKTRLVTFNQAAEQSRHPRRNLRLGFGSVRQSCIISCKNNRSVGQSGLDGFQDRKPANAGIKKKSGALLGTIDMRYR